MNIFYTFSSSLLSSNAGTSSTSSMLILFLSFCFAPRAISFLHVLGMLCPASVSFFVPSEYAARASSRAFHQTRLLVQDILTI